MIRLMGFMVFESNCLAESFGYGRIVEVTTVFSLASCRTSRADRAVDRLLAEDQGVGGTWMSGASERLEQIPLECP